MSASSQITWDDEQKKSAPQVKWDSAKEPPMPKSTGHIANTWDYLKGEGRAIGGAALGTGKFLGDALELGLNPGNINARMKFGQDIVDTGTGLYHQGKDLITNPVGTLADPEKFTGDVLTAASFAAPFAKGVVPPEGTIAGDALRLPGRVRSTVGDYIHTPEGNLTPGARVVGRVGGGVAGGITGGLLGRALSLPDEAGPIGGGYLGYRAGAEAGPFVLDKFFPESAKRVMMREEPRAASIADAIQNERAQSLMRRGKETGRLTLEEARRKGSAQEPFEPLIWESPEEYNAHQVRMKNLSRQASSAGTYHAAQGSVKKPLNLQQRIQRRLE